MHNTLGNTHIVRTKEILPVFKGDLHKDCLICGYNVDVILLDHDVTPEMLVTSNLWRSGLRTAFKHPGGKIAKTVVSSYDQINLIPALPPDRTYKPRTPNDRIMQRLKEMQEQKKEKEKNAFTVKKVINYVKGFYYHMHFLRKVLAGVNSIKNGIRKHFSWLV